MEINLCSISDGAQKNKFDQNTSFSLFFLSEIVDNQWEPDITGEYTVQRDSKELFCRMTQ